MKKLLKALSPQNIYEGSDAVIYFAWTIHITSILFYIISAVLFVCLIVSQYNEGNNVLYWLPVDPNIAVAAGVGVLSVHYFLAIICQVPCNIPLQLRKLTKSLIQFAAKLTISVLMVIALVRYSNHDMIIFLSPLTSMSILLAFFSVVNCFVHIFLVSPSFIQLLFLFSLLVTMIPLSAVVILEGLYSYAIQIWLNRASEVFQHTKRRQKVKRVIKVISIFLPSFFLALQLTFNVFGFQSSIDNIHWLFFFSIGAAALFCQTIEKVLNGIYKWTQKQNPKRSRKAQHYSLIDFIIQTLIEKIIQNNKCILTVRFLFKMFKKLCLLTIYIAFMTLIVDRNHISSITIAWVSMVSTLIVMLFDWKQWQQKMLVAYKIGDIELMTTTVDVENQANDQN